MLEGITGGISYCISWDWRDGKQLINMSNRKPYTKPELRKLEESDPFVQTFMAELNQRFPIVHILKGGFPLCGFSLKLPEHWPDEHKWISYLDKEVHKATCEDCKKEYERDRS